MKWLVAFFVIFCFGCKPNNPSNQNSSAAIDMCGPYHQTLNGVFSSELAEGSMTWSGGTEGKVEIEGVDYNDIICTFVIVDCNTGDISMTCNAAIYNTVITIIDQNTYELDDIPYNRIQ